jgi:type IV pilus assembly protein PilX
MRTPMKSRKQQSGAVLYVALIMLILLALIGIVAMQVAALQERMSSNYQAGNIAFQNAEKGARERENLIKTNVQDGVVPATNVSSHDCEPHDAAAWSESNGTPYVRRLDLCFAWGAVDVPADEAEKTDQIYQVTSHRPDRVLLPSSEAVIDTVFIP